METREIPPFLQKVLDIDVLLTNRFCQVLEKIAPRNWHGHYKALEVRYANNNTWLLLTYF